MLIWFDPNKNTTPSSDWIWVKTTATLSNYILAKVRGVAIPKGEQYEGLAADARAHNVKVTRF